MSPELIRKALMMLRGQDSSAASAPMQSAPMGQAPGLAQAYAQPMAPAIQSQPQPMQFNPQLEAQASGMNNQLEPIVQQIMQHLGMTGMIRNRSNQMMVDPTQG